MFFAPFDQVQRNQQQTFVTFYRKLTFIFKSLFFISLAFAIYNQVTTNGLYFANKPTVTFSSNQQYWRIFTAPFATLDGFYGIVSLVIAFWWLCSLLPGYEKKYSSVHVLLQVFIQNLLVQLAYSLVVVILVRNTYFYETFNDYFFSIGWIPIIIIWIFIFTGENKEEKVNFCFLPVLIKNKYLAWILSCCIILLTIQKTPLIIATLLGAIQFHLFQRSAIRLPMSFHENVEKPFHLISKYCPSFILITDCRDNLQKLLSGKRAEQFLHQISFTLDKIKSENNKSMKNFQSMNNQNSLPINRRNENGLIQLNKSFQNVQENIVDSALN